MKGFFKTVAVVTVFSISEKLLGFLYRIFMSRTIGSEGIGMYQVALSVFGLLFTVCASGTPITVSRLMTKYKAENKPLKVERVISAGLFSTLIFAVPIVLIFFLFNNSLSFIFADERCKNIFLIILPGLIVTSVYSVLRGVFWGNKDFLPYSVIELLEELCMIVCGIVLISFSNSVYQGAYRAGVAVLISYVFSFTLASIVFFVRKNKLRNPFPELKTLLSSSMPITAMRSANSLAVSLVSIILPMRLIASGMPEQLAMSAFGSAVGQAMPLLFIPSTLIGSFTLVLVPEISENFYRKNYEKLKNDIEKSLKIAIFVSCIFIPVFTSLGNEIGLVLFDSAECGRYLTVSAFLMLFMSLSNITTSILNSIGLEKQTLIFYIISGVFMLLSIWFLPSVVGIYSLLVGFTFVYGLSTVLNLILLNKKCPVKPKYFNFLTPSILFVPPLILLGFLLKNLLLTLLGEFFTLIIVASILCILCALLYVVFNLVSITTFTNRLTNVLPKRKVKKV